MDGWMAVEYEKQEQRLVASQVRMARGHEWEDRGVREGGRTEPKRGLMTISRKKAEMADKGDTRAGVTGWQSVKSS